jgi:glucose/arabinose dehydrogenase
VTASRGLLGIALHPGFPQNPSVYLYWTESSTDQDTGVLRQTPVLGNRVDRFVWNGSALTFAQNLIKIRALEQDANQPERGNHDGGVIRFGPDLHFRR